MAALALVLALVGLIRLSAGSTVVSLPRMALAAGVLSAYTAALAIVVTDRGLRTVRRCLVWGGGVPALVGVTNGALVTAAAGPGPGALSVAPWLVGAAVSLLGPRLPDLRLLFPRRGPGRG